MEKEITVIADTKQNKKKKASKFLRDNYNERASVASNNTLN